MYTIHLLKTLNLPLKLFTSVSKVLVQLSFSGVNQLRYVEIMIRHAIRFNAQNINIITAKKENMNEGSRRLPPSQIPSEQLF